MKNWIFLEERSDAGITYMLGKKGSNGGLYRWEPLASRIHGYEAAIFRQSAEKRCKLITVSEQSGILPLEKPVNHQGQLWIGWEARSGKSPFSPNYQTPDLPKLIPELYPLISAYEQFHYRGAVVGRPDWHRVYHNEDGFFMVDPWCRPYLQSPNFQLPSGFAACRTPESYYGDPHAQSGDIFYLGLLIYYLLSNHLPFALEDGWPTSAVLKEEITPITHYCPEVSPALARLLNRMLSAKKYERPSALQVKLFWKDMLTRQSYLATPTEKVVNLNHYRQELELQSIRKISIRLGIILFIGVAAFFSGRYLWKTIQNKPPITKQLIESFYQNNASLLTKPVSSDPFYFEDILQARNQRLQLITELLGHPVVEVKKIIVQKQSAETAQVAVNLLWWKWSGGRWTKELQQELLHLERHGKLWRIEKRLRNDH